MVLGPATPRYTNNRSDPRTNLGPVTTVGVAPEGALYYKENSYVVGRIAVLAPVDHYQRQHAWDRAFLGRKSLDKESGEFHPCVS